jgi:hypothetical protein
MQATMKQIPLRMHTLHTSKFCNRTFWMLHPKESTQEGGALCRYIKGRDTHVGQQPLLISSITQRRAD